MRGAFHPEARGELISTMLYCNGKKRGLGAEFLKEVADCLDYIRRFPMSYPCITGDFRRASVRRFPYSVVYRIANNVVEIIAVTHARRSWNYLQSRLK